MVWMTWEQDKANVRSSNGKIVSGKESLSLIIRIVKGPRTHKTFRSDRTLNYCLGL